MVDGLAGDGAEGDPRVGRAGQAAHVAHLQVVIRAEEGVEPVGLGPLGDGELLGVGRPLLGLDEDAEIHEVGG